MDFRFPFSGYILPETNSTNPSEDALTSRFSATLNHDRYDWNSITIISSWLLTCFLPNLYFLFQMITDLPLLNISPDPMVPPDLKLGKEQ